MIVEVVQPGLPIQYIAFDTLYTVGWLAKRVNWLGLTRVGVLHPTRPSITAIGAKRRRPWETGYR